MNQEGLISKNSLVNHLLEDAFAAPDPAGPPWGTANKTRRTRSTMGQGKDLPCAAYEADEPEMDGSPSAPKMQSPTLLQASAGPMSLPLPPWRAAHDMELTRLGCTYLLDKNLGHWGFAIAAHLKVQGKERKTARKKEEGESHLGISVSFHHTTEKLLGPGSPRLPWGKGTEPALCEDRGVSE